MELTNDQAAALMAELAEMQTSYQAIVQRNLDAVVRWRYANNTPDPLVPRGEMEKVDFDLYGTGEMVCPKITFADKPSDKCYLELGYDAQDQLRYQKGGDPLAWEYTPEGITQYLLSDSPKHSRFRRFWGSPGEGYLRVEVGPAEVRATSYQYEGDRIVEVRRNSWKEGDNGLARNTWYFVFQMEYDQGGDLQQIVATNFDGDEQGYQEVIKVKRSGWSRFFG